MVITVECPSCASSFPVDPAKIPEGGVNARCTVCAEVFRVERPAEEAPEPAEASLPGEAPATQADTEATVEPIDATLDEAPAPEAEVDEPSADGDWQAWAGGGDAVTEEEPEPTSEVSGFEGAAEVEAPEEPEVEAEDESEPEPEALHEDGDQDWVFETGDEPAGVGLEAGAAGDDDTAEDGGDDFFVGEVGDVATEEDDDEGTDSEDEDAPSFDMGEAGMEMESAEAVVEEAAQAEEARDGVAPPEAAPDEPVQGFSFGQRDPSDKARRLARVLVSDMIMYNPERHQRALENGTLKDDFEEEIAKSWKEYVEQVGEEMAEDNDFWTDALNDILAKGEEVF